jgi:mannose-1-phosphate guanylyltransferase/phosphomannomutase
MVFNTVVVIVAGGLGTRARSMTGEHSPKALLPVAGIPIIERQIRTLESQGFRKIVILAGHLGPQIEEFIKNKDFSNRLQLVVLIEPSALGTAGAVISAREHFEFEHLVVVFGDLLFDLDFESLLASHQENQAAATIVCRPNDHPNESDLVEMDDSFNIRRLLPKKNRPAHDYRNLVPTGIYSISRQILYEFSENQPLDFFQDMFPALLKKEKKLLAYPSTAYICDVGTLSGRNAAEEALRSGRVERTRIGALRPTVFFDVDGVLIDDIPGVGITSPNDVRMIPGAGAALRSLNQDGHLAIAVTNRPQLAKGQINRLELEHIFSRLDMQLASEKGYLDKIYFCPHHPEVGHPGEVPSLKVECICRKPEIGLFKRAMDEAPVNLAQSAMIGDTWRDILAARSLGIYAYGVRTGNGCRELRAGIRPDLMFNVVGEAVSFCVNYKKIAESLLQHIDLNRATNGRYLLGISGVSQSGKSCLAHAVERVWKDEGRPVLRVTLDDWILPVQKRFGAKVYDRTQAVMFATLYKDLKNGKTVSTERYDPFTRGSGSVVKYTAPDNALIIVEGVLACSTPAITELDFSFFMDMPSTVSSQRQRALLSWKNLSDQQIETLLAERQGDELLAILSQRSIVNVILNHEGLES